MGEHVAEEPAFRAIPDRVGRFRIERLLGRGGMASVYLAHESGPSGFSRRVALKFLHPHLAEEPSVVAQFVREAKIAARIRHPNVVSVLEVAEHAGLVFLVMDFVDGESLASLIRKLGREAIPVPVGLRMLCDALAGLEAAHELRADDGTPLGIVHRDFTPHNLLIGRDGVARLTDFGVAKISAGTQHTQAGVVKGKIGYMAPEQARGRGVDRRTDVWAAGVVAWELVTRQRLYAGKDDLARLFEIATRTPPRVRSVASDLPVALDESIAQALTRKPNRRCPSAAEFRARLEAACEGGLASHADVQRLVETASLASSSGIRSLERDEEPILGGSLSASISETNEPSASSRRMPRWPLAVAGVVVLGAAGALVFTIDSGGANGIHERALLAPGSAAAHRALLGTSAAPRAETAPVRRTVRTAPIQRIVRPKAKRSAPDAPLADYPER